ncbi:MAG TPA: RNA-binding protein [Chloroflexi bacterium]|nr:RNA-binding protein [Chloroflexota bacterium]|tara:strand:+ start:93 stop:320 length:228 start_codon:yes stop_codon:yes gene_type:complete
MKEFLEYVVGSIVTDKDNINIEMEESGSIVKIRLSVGQDDVGRVIGRRGRTINAIRTLLRAMGSLRGNRVELDIE